MSSPCPPHTEILQTSRPLRIIDISHPIINDSCCTDFALEVTWAYTKCEVLLVVFSPFQNVYPTATIIYRSLHFSFCNATLQTVTGIYLGKICNFDKSKMLWEKNHFHGTKILCSLFYLPTFCFYWSTSYTIWMSPWSKLRHIYVALLPDSFKKCHAIKASGCDAR